jgi:DNA repair protein RadD
MNGHFMNAAGIAPAIKLRPYQEAALAALWDYWRAGGGNPLIEMATGTGKSLVLAELARRMMASGSRRVLVLTHVRELIDQDVKAIRAVWPDAPIGICCAGLGERNTDAPIVVASIQSIFRNPQELGRRNLVVIDEAHLVPADGDGMYQTAIAALRDLYPEMRVCGLTATPYRLDSGRLDEGDGRLFDCTVFSYGIGEAIADRWLAPLVAGATATEIDVQGVARRGGEFVASDLEAAADIGELVSCAADEIVAQGQDRRAWLVFCVGVDHARHVRDALRERGVTAETVTGETPGKEREAIFTAFKAGSIRALTGANVFTTGFDAPAVDLIAMLRPTLSAVLYVQMLGRGTRKADGKVDCRVLDFAGNVRRHGLVDAVTPHANGVARERNDDGGDRRTPSTDEKPCPECKASNPKTVLVCGNCGCRFKSPHEGRADGGPLLTRDLSWTAVDYFTLHRHEKRDGGSGPPTLRVQYHSGPATYFEWLALQHSGTARTIAGVRWRELGGPSPAPATVEEAISRRNELATDADIALQRDGKYWRVIARRVRAVQPELPLIEGQPIVPADVEKEAANV